MGKRGGVGTSCRSPRWCSVDSSEVLDWLCRLLDHWEEVVFVVHMCRNVSRGVGE